MRKAILTIITTVAASAALTLPGVAMADVHATGTVEARGYAYNWDLNFVDAANTVTINATHTFLADGLAAPTPRTATIQLQDSTGVTIVIDAITGKFTAPAGLAGQNFSQTKPGNMLNAGPVTRTGVRLKVSTDRAAGIESSSSYLWPL